MPVGRIALWIVALVFAAGVGYWLSASGMIALTGAGDAVPQPGSASRSAAPGPATRAIFVTTADVQESAPRSRIQSIGTGKAVRFIRVTADVAGTVESISAAPNTDVAEGEPIVALERNTQAILLGGAQAEFDKQSASFTRLNTLFNQNSSAVSQSQMEEARANLAIAEANVAAAQYEYDRRIIRAPFSGRININDLTVGDYLPQGAEIVTLVDASSLLVEFAVSEMSVPQIAAGIPVRLTTPAYRGRTFSGTIVAFDSAIDEENRTVRVRAEVQNPDNVLLPGMTFSVSLSSFDTPLPVVPAVSILWNRNGAYVWRLGPDDVPERVSVVLRHRLGDRVWVEGDLSAGERIVRDGAFKVSDGAMLTVEAPSETGRRGG